jgi:hypothetical protein
MKRSRKQNIESGEEPISSKELFSLLDQLGLVYEFKFLTHIPLLDKFVNDPLRLSITRIVSYPWMKKSGDLLFLYGEKP